MTAVGARLPAMEVCQSMHVATDRPDRGQARSDRRYVWGGLLAALLAAPAFAAPLPELTLVSEHPVDSMVGGNLSGLAMCNGQLWAISDRDDDLLYRMDMKKTVWQAQSEKIDVPPAPESDLPANLRSLAKLSSFVRGGSLDFEGISCDAAGNKYVVSEAHAEVLKVSVEGQPAWLKLPSELVAQARAKGMLQHFNAIFEGLAVSPQGDRLWLAAEREQRGLLVVSRESDAWRCKGSCVLRTEPGKEVLPPQVGGKSVSRDFADLSLFNGKLFTLERSAYRICRRDLETGKTEQCWSFAREALMPNRLYDQAFGLTEALVVDETGAWIGVDNNFGKRADGEERPIVWRFAAPAGGWSAKP
ncbi:esterase-like activity of phytase family protein [Pseudomonas syringae group sp. J309-1]|uniref:esterase-like activity of phytase family protein n=1 Tax=Pseudomonas syringae group sp. J309-1 TaxID=3079588 RepID=UPI00290D24ED|nr:esterase-like activity of phytase family protein [Pseudomonas syringae group sp. J309-1]MDU8362796.1 esterase-like activity of phytase family protein [Pseudomonas syringae group sp. J309-1]